MLIAILRLLLFFFNAIYFPKEKYKIIIQDK